MAPHAWSGGAYASESLLSSCLHRGGTKKMCKALDSVYNASRHLLLFMSRYLQRYFPLFGTMDTWNGESDAWKCFHAGKGKCCRIEVFPKLYLVALESLRRKQRSWVCVPCGSVWMMRVLWTTEMWLLWSYAPNGRLTEWRRRIRWREGIWLQVSAKYSPGSSRWCRDVKRDSFVTHWIWPSVMPSRYWMW